jgi:hypothetical protein
MDFSGMSTVCQKSCEARIARRGVGSAIVVGIIKACGCLPFLRGERSSRQETRKRGRPRRQSLSTRTWNRGGEMRVRPWFACCFSEGYRGRDKVLRRRTVYGSIIRRDEEDVEWDLVLWCGCIYIVAVVPLSPTSRSLTNLAGAGECPRGARPILAIAEVRPRRMGPEEVRRLMMDHGRGVSVAVVPRTCMNVGDSAIRTRVTGLGYSTNSRCRCICKSVNQEGVATIPCCEGIGDSEANLRKQIGAALRWLGSRMIHPGVVTRFTSSSMMRREG